MKQVPVCMKIRQKFCLEPMQPSRNIIQTWILVYERITYERIIVKSGKYFAQFLTGYGT